MKAKWCEGLEVLIVLTSTSGVFAQSFVVVGSQRRVSPPGEYWQECSVGARLGNANEVVISAQEFGVGVHFAVSMSAGAVFTSGTLWPTGGDSGVAVDPATDRIWISSLGLHGIAVA